MTDLSEKDKINIILEEYKALRAEILMRTTIQTQVLAAFGAAGISIVGVSIAYRMLLFCVVMTVLLSLIAWMTFMFLDGDFKNIAIRLREIENEINTRSGDNLFSWETRFGLVGKKIQ